MNDVPPLGEDLSAGRSAAEQRVKNPALGLILTAILGATINVLILLAGLVGLIPPEYTSAGMFGDAGLLFDIASLIFTLAMMAVIYMGAVRMQRLESWGFALAAAIVAMIPCSCTCVIGLPAGIWALVVLLNQEVKGQFR